ncbi:MAG: PEP-CTERM sorting domain-containing protein [Rhodospirillaceae bacterium]|nr:PEP-CTERM sorting domain-containing protein [Rhodospirillaceae bacterium]
MRPNVIGIGDVSGDIDTFLWGKTAAADSGTCAGDCTNIYSAFYHANEGLGIDIAYSGNTVAEPGALALLGLGLIGLGVARRRRTR